MLSQKNDTASAISVFRELVKRDPTFAEGHNNLGLALLQAGDNGAARSEFLEVWVKPAYAAGALQPGISAAKARKGGRVASGV